PCLGDHLVLLEDRALLSFTFAGDGPAPTGAELADVQDAVRDLVRGWRERLEDELRARHGAVEAARLAGRYRAAFPDEYRASTPPVRAGRAASDALGRLVLEAGLDWRAVDCLRAYAGHAAQGGVGPRGLVIDALARHPEAAASLFECFAARFSGRADTAPLRQRFLESLDTVESLRDDVTLRALCDTVEATVRSNYFATPVAETR